MSYRWNAPGLGGDPWGGQGDPHPDITAYRMLHQGIVNSPWTKVAYTPDGSGGLNATYDTSQIPSSVMQAVNGFKNGTLTETQASCMIQQAIVSGFNGKWLYKSVSDCAGGDVLANVSVPIPQQQGTPLTPDQVAQITGGKVAQPAGGGSAGSGSAIPSTLLGFPIWAWAVGAAVLFFIKGRG